MSKLKSKNVFLERLAKKYALKGEKYSFGGPIYYNDHAYWIICYSRRKMFKKPTLTCILVLDKNYNIVMNKNIYSKITLTFLCPRPTSEFLKTHTNEAKEISVVQRFFSRPEKYIGRVNISKLESEIKDLRFKEAVNVLEEIIEQASKIGEISTNLLQIMNVALNDVRELLTKLSWKSIESFIENVVFREYQLLVDLANAFIDRLKLLKKLAVAIENLEDKSIGKIYLLLNETKMEIKALEKLNIYFEKFIKMREGLKTVCEENKKALERFFATMVNRVSSLYK